jgi:hypothetical protein
VATAVLALSLAAAVSAAALYVARIPVLEGRVDVPLLRAVLLEVAPPPDLYAVLASAPLDLTPGSSTPLTVSHRYIGDYFVGVRVAGIVPWPVGTSDTGLRLRWVCRDRGGDVLTRELGADPLPWWRSFRLPGQSGFIFTVYAVPRDLPRAQRLNCSATVVNPGRSFIDRFGSPRCTSVSFLSSECRPPNVRWT